MSLSLISCVMPSPSRPTSPHTTCSLDNSDLFVFLMESNNYRRNIEISLNIIQYNIIILLQLSHRCIYDFLVSQKSRLASFRSYQHENVFYSRTAVQQFPDEHFSHETRTSGDKYGSAIEKLRYYTFLHLGLDLYNQTDENVKILILCSQL